MSRRRASYSTAASASTDELAAMRYGTRSRAPGVLTTADVDEINVPSFWQSVALALVINVVGMLAVAAAAWRWLGAAA